MNLKIYTKKKPNGGSKSLVGILNVNRKKLISINAYLTRTLGLKPGFKCFIAKDTTRKNDWYINFSDENGDGYILRWRSRNRPNAEMETTYNQDGVNELLDSVKAKISASFYIGTANPKREGGKTWYRILTATPKLVR